MHYYTELKLINCIPYQLVDIGESYVHKLRLSFLIFYADYPYQQEVPFSEVFKKPWF